MTFNGFTPPVSNYFRMPNEWTNISAKINNLAELKVVEYVLRHTWGFHEYDGQPKPITIDEFMYGRKDRYGSRIDNGTGLSKPSVVEGLKRAIKNGYLICEVDETDRARVIKAYALKMFSSDPDVKNLDTENGCKESLPQMLNIFTPDVKNLNSEGKDSLHRSEKETLERNSRKKLKERKNGTPSERTSKEATHPSTHSSHPSQKSSFSSSQLEEVIFTEDEQAIYDYGCQTIFKAKPPVKTTKLKEECAEIAKHVKTVEQFHSLLQYVRALPYIKGQIHLKNLVNELNGWLQSLEARPSARTKPTGPHIAQQPTDSQEEIDRRNQEAIAKMRARNAARAAQQQEGATA